MSDTSLEEFEGKPVSNTNTETKGSESRGNNGFLRIGDPVN